MKKLVTFASAVAMAGALSAHADTYEVSGSFIGTTQLGLHLGSPNLLVSNGVTLGGILETDGNAPGYNVTGGIITMEGAPVIDIGTPLTLFFNNVAGTPDNNGVVFDRGEVCFGSTTNCSDLAATQEFQDTDGDPNTPDVLVPVDNKLYFDGSQQFGFQFGAGLQLTGGAGGAAFTVAQPGLITTGGPSLAVGVATLAGNTAGVFFSGDLTMTEFVPPPPSTAIPTMPFYMLGMTIVGLVLVAGRRMRPRRKNK